MKTNNLPYPYNVAFERGDSIDYRVGGWSEISDHEYVEKLGYHVEMGSDCSCFARGLGGLSLSSYGDWGTLHTSFSEEKVKEMFLDMVEKDIIRLWRITAYIKEEPPKVENKEIKKWFRAYTGVGDGALYDLDNRPIVRSYSYENGDGWKTLDEETRSWVYCEDPYKNKKE